MTLKWCFTLGLAFLIGLTFAMAASLRADAPAKSVDSEYDSHYGQTGQEMVFVEALNEYRSSRGLHTVAVSGELSADCRSWSTRMKERGQLSHASSVEMEIIARITEESGLNALRAWQRSPAHNAILLSSRMDTIGIGSDGIWWTMRGTRRNVEHTVFNTMDAKTVYRTSGVKTVVVSDEEIPGYRVPMGVAINSLQRVGSDGRIQTYSSASTQRGRR